MKEKVTVMLSWVNDNDIACIFLIGVDNHLFCEDLRHAWLDGSVKLWFETISKDQKENNDNLQIKTAPEITDAFWNTKPSEIDEHNIKYACIVSIMQHDT